MICYYENILFKAVTNYYLKQFYNAYITCITYITCNNINIYIICNIHYLYFFNINLYVIFYLNKIVRNILLLILLVLHFFTISTYIIIYNNLYY